MQENKMQNSQTKQKAERQHNENITEQIKEIKTCKQ